MATIKVKRTTNTVGSLSLPHGELGIAANELYFGNDSDAPVKIAKDSTFASYLPLAAGSTKPLTGDLYLVSNGNSPKIIIGDANSSGNYGQIQWNSSADRIDIGPSIDIDAISILEDGKVGIGTTNPSEKLEVSGNTKAADFFSTENNLYFGNLSADLKYNGVPEDEKSKWSLSYDATSRVFTLTLSSASYYYVDGKRFDLASGAHTWDAHAIDVGVYYFYFDSTGTKRTSGTVWDIVETAQVAYVIYNPTNDGGGPAGLLAYEIHGIVMPAIVHKYEHLINGTELINAGGLDGITLNTFTADAITWTLGSSNIADEDIFILISGQSESNYNLGYFDASNNFHWRTTSIPIFTDGTDIQYNPLGQGIEAIIGNNIYVNYYIALTNQNSDSGKVIVLPGQATYSTLASAEQETPMNFNHGNLPFQEIVILYRITFKHTVGGNKPETGNSAIAATPKLVIFNNATLATSSSDHNLLSNRSTENSHPATAISYDPAVVSLLSATNTQTAIDELATEKVNILNGTATELIVTNDAVGDVPLIVNGIVSTTAHLQDWKVNASTVSFISSSGLLYGPGLAAVSTASNAYIQTAATGTFISRNVADANDALQVNLANASSTGDITEFQKAGTMVAKVENDGSVNTSSSFKYGSAAYTKYNATTESIDFVFA